MADNRPKLMADVGPDYVAINWHEVEVQAKVCVDPIAHNFARVVLAARDKTWIPLPGSHH